MASQAAPWRRLWPLIALLAIVIAIAGIASFTPAVLQRRTTQGLINLIAVVGLYVFVGNSGVLSFGNVAFMAIGAYVSALLTMKPTAKSVFLPDLPAIIARAEWPALPGALAGGCVAAVVSLAVGWPLMRLSGVSASIATFAILVVAYVVFGNWTAVTGGRGRQHVHDGTTVEYTYAPGETRHETYGPGQFKVHDLENLGDKEMVFMTIEFLQSANRPLPLPASVRPQAAA